MALDLVKEYIYHFYVAIGNMYVAKEMYVVIDKSDLSPPYYS